jgi:hypothetical protein
MKLSQTSMETNEYPGVGTDVSAGLSPGVAHLCERPYATGTRPRGRVPSAV